MLAFTALIAVLPLLASAAPLKRADNTQIHIGDKQDYVRQHTCADARANARSVLDSCR